MAIPSNVAEAITRLSTGSPTGYNNGVYNAANNPFGFSDGGHRINLYALTADMVLVSDWFYDELSGLVDIADDIAAVGAIADDVTTVASVDAAVAALGPIAANITTVAGIVSEVTTVAGDSADIQALGAISTAISTLAAIASDVSAVAGMSGDVSALAAIAGDIETVADNITAIQGAAQAAQDAEEARDLAQGYALSAKSVGRFLNFSDSTSDADPGNGNFRLNAGSFASTTTIFVDLLDNEGTSITNWIGTWDDSTTAANRGQLTLTKANDLAQLKAPRRNQ